VLTSPLWAERDAQEAAVHPAEALSFGEWLRLGDGERAAVVASYAAPRRQRLALASAE
jgi:hypothetical protein